MFDEHHLGGEDILDDVDDLGIVNGGGDVVGAHSLGGVVVETDRDEELVAYETFARHHPDGGDDA